MSETRPHNGGWKSTLSMISWLWLVIYNALMVVAHVAVLIQFTGDFGKNNFKYEEFYPIIKLLTALQFFDIFHGVIGLTRTSIGVGMLQVGGRLLVLYFITTVPGLGSNWFVSLLLFAYLTIEIIRYPFYFAVAFDKKAAVKPGLLSWLRYNSWIILYPVGISMEYLCLSSTFAYHYQQKTLEAYLPNSLDSKTNTLCVWLFLNGFLYVIFPYIGFSLLYYMYVQRCKKMNRPFMKNPLARLFSMIFGSKKKEHQKKKN